MASLVNISTKPQQAQAVTATEQQNADGGQVGVFVTAQSLVTFPVATAAVTTMWRVLISIESSLSHRIVPFLLALLIGGLIYMMSVTNATTFKEKFTGAGIALINSFTIAAAALGIGRD